MAACPVPSPDPTADKRFSIGRRSADHGSEFRKQERDRNGCVVGGCEILGIAAVVLVREVTDTIGNA
jgi:hypothetical protein